MVAKMGFLPIADLAGADGVADGGAHVQAGVHGVQGRQRAQGVAADVAVDVAVRLLQLEEDAAVGTARAEDGRARQHGRGFGAGRRRRGEPGAGEPGPQAPGGEFAEQTGDRLAFAGDAGGPQLLFGEAVQLFDYTHAVNSAREPADLLQGQRVAEAEPEEAGRGQHLASLGVGGAGGDDAEPALAPLDAVQRRLLAEGAQALHALLDVGVPRPRVAGHHDELLRVLLEAAHGGPLDLACGHDALAVAHARGHAQEHGHVEALADLHADLDEVLAILAVGRLEHGDLGEAGVVAIVLLVLAAVQLGIVRADDDEAADHAGVGQGHQGVGRHVEPDVLLRAEGARAAEGGAGRHLEAHLLVGGPLHVHLGHQLGDRLEDLRAGRARIARAQMDTGLAAAQRHGLVAREQKADFLRELGRGFHVRSSGGGWVESGASNPVTSR